MMTVTDVDQPSESTRDQLLQQKDPCHSCDLMFGETGLSETAVAWYSLVEPGLGSRKVT